MDLNLYENRCGTFRWHFQRSVEDYIELVENGERRSPAAVPQDGRWRLGLLAMLDQVRYSQPGE
jgi:hypothetical protein